MSQPENDDILHPARYTRGKIEVWDFIVDQKLGFLEGNIIKYVCRYKDKEGLKSLEKARAYLDRLIHWRRIEEAQAAIKSSTEYLECMKAIDDAQKAFAADCGIKVFTSAISYKDKEQCSTSKKPSSKPKKTRRQQPSKP